MHNFDLRPKLGRVRGKENRRFLLVCHFDPTGIATIYEYVALWQNTSRFQIEVLNLWPWSDCISSSVRLSDFDGCILHSTVTDSPKLLFHLDHRLKTGFAKYDGLKILIKQDEYRSANEVCRFVKDNSFDLLITCVPPTELYKVYPRAKIGKIHFVHAYTGYVSPVLRDFAQRPDGQRTRDISYRGSIQPLWVGRLGFEKRKIGYDVAAACAGRDLALDISSRPQDRIGGNAWFNFLAGSKAVLGTESGSNMFDFTGEIEAWCNEFCRKNKTLDQLSEAFYRRAHNEYLKDFEENVNYAQISPRHFEAAATGTLQILYEGEYSGILKPFRHFVPLRRDLANLEEVLDIVHDERRRREITEAAREEVIGDRRHGYEHFVARLDEAIDGVLSEKGRISPTSARAQQRPRALLLMAHEPLLDPRIEWMGQRLAQDYELCEIGTYRDNEHGAGPSVERLSNRRWRVRVERTRHDWDWILPPRDADDGASAAAHQLALLFMYARLPERALRRAIGAHDADASALERFRWLCTYFVNTNGALIEAARLIGSFDVIIATDLDTLPAALMFARENSAVVVYDSHEYRPYSFHDFQHWEVEFWSGVERALVKETDIRITVSPPLAARLSADYGYEFAAVPNCAPLADAALVDVPARLRRRRQEPILFLFQGGFSPGRGIEHVIAAWKRVETDAKLLLRGPASPFKKEMEKLAQSLGLKDRRVFFPEAVSEDRLVAAAAEADVGLIPYEPNSPNNRFCCPNKLSQYLAAGLPIIANELDFVQQVVLENRLGAIVAFRDTDKLVQVIEQLASRERLAEMSLRAQAFFRSGFHWEAVSSELFDQIKMTLSARQGCAGREWDFSWIGAGHDMSTLAIEAFQSEPPIPVAVPMPVATDYPAAGWRNLSRHVKRRLLLIALHPRTRLTARRFMALLPGKLSAALKARLLHGLWRLY